MTAPLDPQEEMNVVSAFGAPSSMSPEDVTDYVHATTKLIEKSGASGFNIGYTDPENPHNSKWYVEAYYDGARIMVDNLESPWAAMLVITNRILTGAKCKCGRLVATNDEGAYALSNPVMADGESFTVDQAKAAGMCRWRLVRDSWVPGCNR